MISRTRTASEKHRAARAAWQRHLAAWRTSGQTQAAYCRRHGVNEQRFSWWKRRLEKRPPGPARHSARRSTPLPPPKVGAPKPIPTKQAAPAFVPLTLRAPGWGAGTPAWACELAWADGRRLRFRDQPTPAELRAYAAAWQERPPMWWGPPSAVRIYLAREPADLRRSFAGLSALVREQLREDPAGGAWFVFRNRRGDRLKLLYWDGNGWALWYRQLAAGRYHWPDFAAVKREINGAELTLLLAGVDVEGAKRYKRFHYRAGETVAAPDAENILEIQ